MYLISFTSIPVHDEQLLGNLDSNLYKEFKFISIYNHMSFYYHSDVKFTCYSISQNISKFSPVLPICFQCCRFSTRFAFSLYYFSYYLVPCLYWSSPFLLILCFRSIHLFYFSIVLHSFNMSLQLSGHCSMKCMIGCASSFSLIYAFLILSILVTLKFLHIYFIFVVGILFFCLIVSVHDSYP